MSAISRRLTQANSQAMLNWLATMMTTKLSAAPVLTVCGAASAEMTRSLAIRTATTPSTMIMMTVSATAMTLSKVLTTAILSTSSAQHSTTLPTNSPTPALYSTSQKTAIRSKSTARLTLPTLLTKTVRSGKLITTTENSTRLMNNF